MHSKLKVVGVVASLPPVVVLVDRDGVVLRQQITSQRFRRLAKRHPVLASGEPSRCQLNLASERGRKRGRCRHTSKIAAATSVLLGTGGAARSCELVSSKKMDRILRQHNWDSGEGVVGFHTPDDRIYVTHQWSLPHEWVHAAGLVDDKLSLWVCEGLTEAVAQRVAHASRTPYKPTYSYERELVERELAPALGLTPVELARKVVEWYGEGKSPAKEIARMLGRPALRKHLDRGTGDKPAEELLKVLRTTNARP